MCDPNYANGYEADFDVMLDASAFCFSSCGGVSITITSQAGVTFPLYEAGGNCPTATACTTCTFARCPGHGCPPPTFPQTFRWNGDYAEAGGCTACTTPGCGPAIACQNLRCAPAGHYIAKFCASRVASGADAGASCTPGTAACTTTAFDLPSTTPLQVLIQP